MSELNIEDLKELPEYTRVREEFEIATKLRAAFHVGSAMLNVDELLRAARRAPVSTPQQSAQRASVDTIEFADLMYAWSGAAHSCDKYTRTEGAKKAWAALIAHINAWGSAGSGAIPEGWISVAQHLPEFGQTVLIRFAKSGHVEDATFHQDEYSDGWTYCLFDGERLNDEPSHWMPLPAAPSPAPQGEQA